MPIPTTVQAVPRALARDEIYRLIKQWIVELVLAPDEIIRDQELALKLGVSRTPVREALRRLEDEGLVVTSFHKWTKVAPSNMNEAAQLYPVVAALEAAAAELAAPLLSAEELGQLDTINRALGQAISAGDAAGSVWQDRQFHALIVRAGANPEIEKILDTLLPRLWRIELAHFGDRPAGLRSVDQHAALIGALRQRDGKRAAEIVKTNWLQ